MAQNRFVYHYSAHYQMEGSTRVMYIDGVAQMEKRICDMEDYRKLKLKIEPFREGALTIDNLSFLGMEFDMQCNGE